MVIFREKSGTRLARSVEPGHSNQIMSGLARLSILIGPIEVAGTCFPHGPFRATLAVAGLRF
jgi:hypothetical protein